MIYSCQCTMTRVRFLAVKIPCTALLALMLLFAALQYNDPDGLAWAALYAVPVAALLAALLHPALLATPLGRAALGVALAGLGIGTALCWPEQAGFWRRDVWWQEETAREGMGMAVALAATAATLPFALRRGRGPGA